MPLSYCVEGGGAIVDYIKEYLGMVKKDKPHLMCKEQKQLAALIENVLKEDNVFIDEQKVEKYLSYQKYFPFKLFEWEKFILVLMLCTYCKDTGLPRFGTLFCLVGRLTRSGEKCFNKLLSILFDDRS